jgi:hypothetical protein
LNSGRHAIDIDTASGTEPMSVQPAGVPRVALSRQEAAASLGMSLDSFGRHVQPELKLIRRGKLRLIPVVELERWAIENAEGFGRGR